MPRPSSRLSTCRPALFLGAQAVLLSFALSAWGQTRPDSPSDLTVARIFSSEEFHAEHAPPIHWLKDGSAYLTLENAEGGKGRDVVRHDPATGQREVLIRAAQLVPEGSKGPLGIADFAVSDDGRKLLFFTNTRKVWRLNTRGDYWVFDRDKDVLRKLGGKAPEASLMFAAFDPRGKHVAYVRQNNLYVEDVATGAITPLTKDGSDTLINGTFDWVYEEELSLRDGFRWSPDGDRVAYWQVDSSGVPEYPMLDTAAGLYPKVVPVRYPKTGEKNPAARVSASSRPRAARRGGSRSPATRGRTTSSAWNGRRSPTTW